MKLKNLMASMEEKSNGRGKVRGRRERVYIPLTNPLTKPAVGKKSRSAGSTGELPPDIAMSVLF